MALDRISLARFRNHADTALEGAAGFNLLVGANGAGKTNILEALSLLAPGRGLRRATLAEMAQVESAGGFAVGASLEYEGEPVRLGTWTDPEPNLRRKVRVNGAETSAAALGEWLAMGWLTPAMDGLFMGPAQERRRYLDRLALARDPMHGTHAAAYEKALRERNRLLADRRDPDGRWFDAIEAQMADHGARLAHGRQATVDALMARIVAQDEAPFPRPALTYAPGGPVGRDQFAQALHDGRARDRAAQRTLAGPHRDELEVYYAARRMPAAQCSTGEQKALLLAMTLAHAAMAAAGRPSVLLLDEVAAHLDPDRRAALFDRLRAIGTQVWMTGTEIAPFSAIEGTAAVWEVAAGAARRL
ncbi:DNA replication/repair protein RecF [Qipengyuania sp. MTN3-11]|uniref:DNA replication/repair protein RecF n=1 Tax=Qipengyuania sp. MTN3-11 TaxID=3056557 RepID=UPI0036F22A85